MKFISKEIFHCLESLVKENEIPLQSSKSLGTSSSYLILLPAFTLNYFFIYLLLYLCLSIYVNKLIHINKHHHNC